VTRKCENWLLDFKKWTYPRSEAPESYLLWTGLFTLASALRRRVTISKKWLGSWSVYPFVYVIFVAPPGKARKSTTGDYSTNLLRDIPDISLAPSAITQQALLKRLAESKDSSISIFSREFASFIGPSGDLMYTMLTDIFDGKDLHDYQTLARDIELVDKPCINLLACTTPVWVARNMPEDVIGGGFASRVIFIHEDRVRRRQLFYEQLDHEVLKKIEYRLKEDLVHISSLEGEFKFDEDAKTMAEQWYRSTADTEPDDSKLHGYYERKPAYVMKLAMILHLAYDDNLVINVEDLKLAVSLMDQVERRMALVYRTVGRNPFVVDMDQIVEHVRRKGKVSRKELLSRFSYAAEPMKLAEMISGLVAMGELVVNGSDPSDITYSAT
jgi:hypothetical protein